VSACKTRRWISSVVATLIFLPLTRRTRYERRGSWVDAGHAALRVRAAHAIYLQL
jgi:hypothetical protein